MANVSNRESLKRWFEGKPIQCLVAVSTRSALRVAPLLASALHDGSGGGSSARASIILPAFRGLAVSWVASMWPTRGNAFHTPLVAGRDAVHAAAARAAGAVVYPHAYAYAAAAAASAASAATFVCAPSNYIQAASFEACDAAAYSACAAARVSSSYPGYAAISRDTQVLDEGMSLTKLSGERLWFDPPPVWASDSWNELKKALLAVNEEWDVWTEWYEGRREGRPGDRSLEISQVSVAEEIWRQGPKVANAYLEQLRPKTESPRTPKTENPQSWDFFLSYSNQDELFARWIEKLMSAAGFRIFSQLSDIPVGSNFVEEMQRGLTHSARFIAIQSPAYNQSHHCQSEWGAAYRMDPAGARRKLIQFLIRPTELRPLAGQIVYKSLIGLSGTEAAAAVLKTIGHHGNMPAIPPAWPGAKAS